MLFPPTARVVGLDLRIVTDRGKELLAEERTVVGELRRLAAVAEALRGMRDRERQRQYLADAERPLELIYRVHSVSRLADQAEGPVELDLRDRFVLIRYMDLRERLRALVLQGEASGARKGALLRKNIDHGIDCGDLRLIQFLVLLELALIVCQPVAPLVRGHIFIQHMRVVVIPAARCGRDEHE